MDVGRYPNASCVPVLPTDAGIWGQAFGLRHSPAGRPRCFHGDKRLQLNEFRREAKNEGLTPRRFELASPHEAPPGWKPVGDGPEARPASDLKAIKLHVLSSIQSHQSPPGRHFHRLSATRDAELFEQMAEMGFHRAFGDAE